jgi:hypothetical protein
MMDWRNPKRNANGSIDVEILHQTFGWIPFTADAADKGARFDVAALVAEIEAAGPIPDYEPPLIDVTPPLDQDAG